MCFLCFVPFLCFFSQIFYFLHRGHPNSFDSAQDKSLRINGSFTLTINNSSILPTSTVHNCSPINMRGIRITIEVMVFLLTAGWFDQAHHKESGQRSFDSIEMQRIHRERSQWVRRICGAEILTLQLKNGA